MQGFEADLQTLELDQNASDEEFKQAYRDLVMVWHPDRFPHNPRLRQKAEAKLKSFNQAYAHLKGRRQMSAGSVTRPSVNAPDFSSSWRSAPRAKSSYSEPKTSRSGRSTQAASSGSRHRDLNISLEDAVFILQHFSFQLFHQSGSLHRQYQGGPFVLAVFDAPVEVILSVPCDSLQGFDRILLSIPCKSMGHFVHQEAELLLRLLQAQD